MRKYIFHHFQVSHCFAKSRGEAETGVSGTALKGFKEIMNSRFHGEPCTPESLVVSGYEPDAHFVRETNVLEVEIVSFQDNKAWFIFEVELDGQTKISHIVIIDQNLCVTICGRCRRLRARRIRSFHSPLFQAENTSYKS